MQKYILLLFIVIASFTVHAQQFVLSGRVTDVNGKQISFASVYIRHSTYGTTANEQGRYQLKLDPGTYSVIYRFAGYQELTDKITVTDRDVQHDVQMIDESYALKRFEKTRRQPADSAIAMVRKAIANRQYFQHQLNGYTCVAYIKGVQKLVSAPKALMNQNVANALSIDSTGKGILYQTESISNFAFRQPNKFKEAMINTTSAGQSAAFSYNKASDLSADFYQDLLTVPGLSSHGFISPLAGKALQYYNYFLVGSKIESGVIVHKIQLLPKRPTDPVFTGYIYLTDGDWHLYSADLMLTDKANKLNLLDTLRISQDYVPIRDSIWEPLTVRYSFSGNVLGFKFDGYYLGIYNNYKIDPDFPPDFFNGERMRVDTNTKSKDMAYWQGIRPVPLTAQENRDYANKAELATLRQAMQNFDETQGRRNHFNILPYIPFGYKAVYKNGRDTIFYQPFIQTIFYNTVEGGGINLKATYTHKLDTLRSYDITPNLRYGFSDKLLNANVRGEYNYDPYHQGKFIGGFGSDLLDLNNEGTRSLYFNTLSTLLSGNNYVKYYRSEFIEGGFQREIKNGLLLKADLSYANRTQLYNNTGYSFSTKHLTSNNPLAADTVATNDRSFLFPENQALTLTASLTYTFDQEYITTPSGRQYLPSAYPQIRLTYRKGINGLFGSDVDYDFASLEFYQEHLGNSISGFSSFKFGAGDFFNNSKVYFMDYAHFIGNQGTTFDPTPGSFHFLPFYTYSTDGPYFEGHFEHNFSGYFFSRIPFLRALKLDEIIGANFLATNQNRDYSEFYVGVQRLIFRVDYGISYEGSHKYLQGFRIFYGIK